MKNNRILILGAGPAGLTSAYKLSEQGFDVSIIEADSGQVGGLSKTINHNGYLVDIGGHRFFSKSREVNEFWKELLPDDFIEKKRYSRIYYSNIFFDYPLKPFQCLIRLPLLKSIRIILSLCFTKLFPVKNVSNIEEWFVQKFGHELYLTFFKSYTEKVWGLKCKEISKDWATQRIQDLSLFTIFKNSFNDFFHLKSTKVVKTLSTRFLYPTKGPGMLWDKCAEVCRSRGVQFYFNTFCTELVYDEKNLVWNGVFRKENQNFRLESFDNVISSIPIPALVECLRGVNSSRVSELIGKFKFRDFIMVLVVIRKKNNFEDNWIYIHNENVKVGRIQIFNNWSREMVINPDENTSLGLEFFCQESDMFWNKSDEEIVDLSKLELGELNLISKNDLILETKVMRVKKAYPVYHNDYAEDLHVLREIITNTAPQVFMVGRNGMHRYNNQDHSIMTAFVVSDNLIKNNFLKDQWKVNQDAIYIESENAL